MQSNRDRIIDTAERLFAARGSQAVSLREINTAAGVSQGVLHYQFGGRDGLIEALLDRRLPAITEHRSTLLATVKNSGAAPTYRQVIEVLVLPLAHLSLTEGKAGQRFLRLLDNLSRERNRTFQRVSHRYFSQVSLEFDELTRQVFPDRSPDEIRYRQLTLAYSMYIAAAELVDPQWSWASSAEPPRPHPIAPEERLEMLLDMYCHGISGLATGPRS